MNLPIAPIAATLAGAAAAAVVLALPAPMLERAVLDSGVAAIVAAAEPPLGPTARAALAAGAGSIVALLAWFTVFVLIGSRQLGVANRAPRHIEAAPTPSIRRADAHPDAPPRAPVLATRDLGTPFLDVTASRPSAAAVAAAPPAPAVPAAPPPAPPVTLAYAAPIERPLPADLDQPLAAFDPAAVPAIPLPASLVLPRRRSRPATFDPSERFETFELTPPVRPAPAAPAERIAAPATESSVHALLDRLEKGVVTRGLGDRPGAPPSPREAERGLEDALVTLRNLARRA